MIPGSITHQLGLVSIFLSYRSFLQNIKGQGLYPPIGTLCLVCIRYSVHVSKLSSGLGKGHEFLSHCKDGKPVLQKSSDPRTPDLSVKSDLQKLKTA